MNPVRAIFRRELASYFATPVAYVFIVIFLVLAGAFTFYLGGFYERGQADLQPFFNFHPWLYLFLVPAVAMRLWSEERKSGTIELLLTLPITMWQAVVGKFFAAWAFIGIALALTFPTWITVNYLGSPDNGVIDMPTRLTDSSRLLAVTTTSASTSLAPSAGACCAAHNAEVGGVANSQHLYGLAADLHSAASPAEMKAAAEEVLGHAGGIGLYGWGIHVDTRQGYARWKG